MTKLTDPVGLIGCETTIKGNIWGEKKKKERLVFFGENFFFLFCFGGIWERNV